MTFTAVHGTFSGGVAEKTVFLSGYEGDTLKLSAEDIPTAGKNPDTDYQAGSWDIVPSEGLIIDKDTVFKYTYSPKQTVSHTVTFKVVNGSWDGDEPSPISVKHGDVLSSAQIPAVGSKPDAGYSGGSWSPALDTPIEADTTFTYTFKKQEEHTPGSYSLTIHETVPDHTYTAYQIFTGTKMDHSQRKYVKATEYDKRVVYYKKVGADFVPVTDVNEETWEGLYITAGKIYLGEPVWGEDITEAGKKALYEAYEMEVEDLDARENVHALLDKIAEGNKSESDKAVKFAEVFFETSVSGEVTQKAGLLSGPTGGEAVVATGSTVTFDNLMAGYYIVNDSYNPASSGGSGEGGVEVNGVDYSIARIAVQVVGDTQINNRADKPTVEKELTTATFQSKKFNGTEETDAKANELSLGKAVNYETTSSVPEYTGYRHYYFNICDKMSEGLTFVPGSVEVKVGDKVLESGTDYYLYYDKTKDSDILGDNTFLIAFENIMDYQVGASIKVTYSAMVNSSAVTGEDPNTNEVKIQYSNNPRQSDQKDNKPGVPDTEEHPVGITPSRFTVTYTTKIAIHKVDPDDRPLEGAEFTLTGTGMDVKVEGENEFVPDENGAYFLLKDGTYTQTPPAEKRTVVEIANGTWVEDENGTTTVGEKKYREYDPDTDGTAIRYKIMEPNASDYASTTVKYSPVTKTSTVYEDYDVKRIGKTDASGNLDFSQLGAGTYCLRETRTPDGYNTISDIYFTINCTLPEEDHVWVGTEKASWSISGIQPEGTEFVPETGTFKVTIVNMPGAELPSTGGERTRLLYMIGAVLLIMGGVLIVGRYRS